MHKTFFDNETQVMRLINRMVALHQAIKNQKITEQELSIIASLSVSDLETTSEVSLSSEKNNESIEKLKKILIDSEDLSDNIDNADALINALKSFEQEHGQYLPLLPLSVENTQTLSSHLNDFAIFYDVFIKHMSYSQEKEALRDTYQFSVDLRAAKMDWLRWQNTRPMRMSFDPKTAEHPAIFEKFLAGALNTHEWLTDLDIQRELKLLGLGEKVHVVPFNADDLGLVLHFEREKHQYDNPKTSYVIPLIVNLGEDDNSRLNSRGMHWTRMLVRVNPTDSSTEIHVDYKDELFLHENRKKAIDKTIRDALKYKIQLGGYASNDEIKIYTAFPECDKPTINITGSGEQKDGYTCGYRALKGIVADLIENNNITTNETYQSFLNCNDAVSLRDWVYRSLLGNQPISNDIQHQIKQHIKADNFFKINSSNQPVFINPKLVEGQLLALSRTSRLKKSSKKKVINPTELSEIADKNEQITQLSDTKFMKALNIVAQTEDDITSYSLTVDVDTLMNDQEINRISTDTSLVLEAVIKKILSIHKDTKLTTLTLNIPENTVITEVLYQALDTLPPEITLECSQDSPASLKQYIQAMNARNNILIIRKITTQDLTPWDALFENSLFQPPLTPKENRFEWLKHEATQIKEAFLALGEIGFVKYLAYIAAHEDRIADSSFPFDEFNMKYEGACTLNPQLHGNFNPLKLLAEHLISEDNFTPFKRWHFLLSSSFMKVDDKFDQEKIKEQLFEPLKKIMAANPSPETLEIEIDSLEMLNKENIDELIQFIQAHESSTVISFKQYIPKTQAQEKTVNPIDPHLLPQLKALENLGMSYQRQKKSSSSMALDAVSDTIKNEPIFLGKIGKAIFSQEGLKELRTEVQIQAQEQQQVQQQIQTAVIDEDLPDEDALNQETYLPYTSQEEVVSLETFYKLACFHALRYANYIPNQDQAFSLITGITEYITEYKKPLYQYGIKKMTISAAKMLIEHLEDVQYGLHPDNLPRGFSLEQDNDGNLVLTYTAVNPPINPKESPLTIRFSKPLAPIQWSGNALQFMIQNTAEKLLNSLYENKHFKKIYRDLLGNKNSFLSMKSSDKNYEGIKNAEIQHCVDNFFFLKSDNDKLTSSIRFLILQDFIAVTYGQEKGKIIATQIQTLFGDTLSNGNIKALSDILYQQGADALSKFLEQLINIKTIKGDEFFKNFKNCFIEPSQNLNELTTESAYQSMQQLLTFSSAQTAWWLSLTQQHSENIYYRSSDGKNVKKRWSNLSELTDGFVYFCAQLEELHPSLRLPESCPLKNIGDMRVGLDRLLTTILPNAHNIQEQFYEGLTEGLSLDPLGPFYASRYEGYKLVTESMMLNRTEKNSFITNSDSKFTFRCDKKDIKKVISEIDKQHMGQVDKDKAKKAVFMRYIATFNHRAPLSHYMDAFELVLQSYEVQSNPVKRTSETKEEISKRQLENKHKNDILILIARYGTGKRGKHFTQADVKALIDRYKVFEEKKVENSLIHTWISIIDKSVQPTLREIVEIFDFLQSNIIEIQPKKGDSEESKKFNSLINTYFLMNSPKLFMHSITSLINIYAPAELEQAYLDALLLLIKNKQNIGARHFQAILFQIEGMEPENLRKNPAGEKVFEPIVDLTPNIRVATAKLLAVCKLDNKEYDFLDQAVLEQGSALYRAVEACFKKENNQQTTRTLLELLGHIDVEKSGDLPTLNSLIQLINDISRLDDIPSYAALEATVKRALPENCMLKTEAILVPSVEPVGSLDSILKQHMNTVIVEINKVSMLPQKQKQQLVEELSKPEGPKYLLKMLPTMGAGFTDQIIQRSIQNVMRNVYDSTMNMGLSRIAIKDKNMIKRLEHIVQKKLTHRVKQSADFKDFIALYGDELQALDNLIATFQRMYKTWPLNFEGVLNIFEQTKDLEHYSLSALVRINQALIDNFSKEAPFPTDLLEKLLTVDLQKKTDQHVRNLTIIIDNIFGKEEQDEIKTEESKAVQTQEKPDVLNDVQKQRLCEFSLRYLNSIGESGYVDIVKALKALKEPYLSAKLTLLTEGDLSTEKLNNINKAFETIQTLQDPALIDMSLKFFIEDENGRQHFTSVMTAIKDINSADKKDIVLAIALKAAQIAVNENELSDHLIETIKKLGKLDDKILLQLNNFYQSLRYPSLSRLKDELESLSDKKAVLSLQADYDCNYWEKEHQKTRDFSTAQVTQYIDNLQDLYYDRPLLLSERKTLQEWFLYINAIGNELKLPIDPKDSQCEMKSVKTMSHQEIQGLIKYYREQLQTQLEVKEHIRIRLETIALLREAMYRGTGRFPRATQILYLLTAMQSGKDFIAQIQTGEGKSLTSALAAAMANIEGKTVDVCTSNLALARDGLTENESFFKYLGISTQLIHANSREEDYKEGNIHYSSMSDLALYRSRMTLLGKKFADNASLIADEADFSTLDDSTLYRFAEAIDRVDDPYQSPYLWIYEALVQFVDMQNKEQSDEHFLQGAKDYLKLAANNQAKKNQLKNLESQPNIYNKRLETWLIAAGKTGHLIKEEEKRFRVIKDLPHKKYGHISKACIITGSRSNMAAEFSDAIQQFLHLRLREKYRAEIDSGRMPDFLVEPEKTYITSLNSKILLNQYQQRIGMTGTAGSAEEIKEQYAKYGFRFVNIPPFQKSKREDKTPLLTNPNTLNNLDAESQAHIKLIVDEILKTRKGPDSQPILIHCADKVQGEKISEALIAAAKNKNININNQIQRYYSSEKPTEKERNEEESEIKKKAGGKGMITIASVFGRGTDINPDHRKGLYTIDTFVDTKDYSSEDLERARRQKIGRSGRAGQEGSTRLIVRRSEFLEVKSIEALKKLKGKELDSVITQLNEIRNKTRVLERESREFFEDVKNIIFNEFLQYVEFINNASVENTEDIFAKLKAEWTLISGQMDVEWQSLQHDKNLQQNFDQQQQKITEFACKTWNDSSKAESNLRKILTNWLSRHQVSLELPQINPLYAQEMQSTIKRRYDALPRLDVKQKQYEPLSQKTSDLAVYIDFMASDPNANEDELKRIKTSYATECINNMLAKLNTPACRYTLGGKFILNANQSNSDNVKNIMAALLYLQYKAYRDGNLLGYAKLKQASKQFQKNILRCADDQLTQVLSSAQQAHFNHLTQHIGAYEDQKVQYLTRMMSEARKVFSKEIFKWKHYDFSTWWNGPANPASGAAIKAQAQTWLKNYQNQWWKRGWVSGDRKAVVTKLLENLQGNNKLSPDEILKHIAIARNELLENDKRYRRPLKNTLNGRLYQYLHALEIKVQTAMTPEQLDNNTDLTLNNIQQVLEHANTRGIHIFNNDLVKLLEELKKKEITSEEKYRALTVFFNNVLFREKPPAVNGDDWAAFRAYCQQTRIEMVHYFAQCEQNHSFNEKLSIAVYQAGSSVMQGHLYGVLNKVVKTEQLSTPSKIMYENKEIIISMEAANLVNLGTKLKLLQKLTDQHSLQTLLSSLKNQIIENAPNNTIVEFEKIEIKNSEGHESEAIKANDKKVFQLSIMLKINGIETRLNYHINFDTGQMYVDDKSLQVLNPLPQDSSCLSLNDPNTVRTKVQNITDKVAVIAAESQELIKEQAEKIRCLEKQLQDLKEAQDEKKKTNTNWIEKPLSLLGK
jgi:hypothetical protein